MNINIEQYKYPNGVITPTSGQLYNTVEPCVVPAPDGSLLMYVHTGIGGTEKTELYTSPDGTNWTWREVVLTGAYRTGVVINPDSDRPYWAYAETESVGIGGVSISSISLYTSVDGRAPFVLDTANVLRNSTNDTDWDSGWMANPVVWKEDGTWYMLYDSTNMIDRNSGNFWWASGIATSTDGRVWIKDASNPIEINGFPNANWVTAGCGPVKKVGTTYYMVFHGKWNTASALEMPTEAYIAKSPSTGTALEKLRGPWTHLESMSSTEPFITRTKAFEGVGNDLWDWNEETGVGQWVNTGQVADIYPYEFNGETFFYYSGLSQQTYTVDHPCKIGLVKVPMTYEALIQILETIDVTAPTVTTFVIPATSTSLTVPITDLTATDDEGVTGYMITESSTAPLASDAGWGSDPPSSVTFSGTGNRTAWAWAKDAAGNVSAGVSASVTVGAVPVSAVCTVPSFGLNAALGAVNASTNSAPLVRSAVCTVPSFAVTAQLDGPAITASSGSRSNSIRAPSGAAVALLDPSGIEKIILHNAGDGWR